MAGYNFVNGQLQKVDPADFSAASKAQVYMSDAEYAARGAGVSISGPAVKAASGGGYQPTILSRKDGTASVSSIFDKNVGAGLTAQTVNAGVGKGSGNFITLPGGQQVAANRWGDAITRSDGSGYIVDGAMQSASQVNDLYSAGTAPKQTVQDTPAMQPTQPISETVAQQVPTIAQPTKSDPIVQAAGTAEKKIIQDTYSRQDTIVSEPDSKIYKVRAGYRRKSKLGS